MAIRPPLVHLAGLGRRIRAARRMHGWTQHQLACEADVSQTHVTRWECGRNEPSLSNLIRVAQALGVSLDSLVFGKQGSVAVVSAGVRGAVTVFEQHGSPGAVVSSSRPLVALDRGDVLGLTREFAATGLARIRDTAPLSHEQGDIESAS